MAGKYEDIHCIYKPQVPTTESSSQLSTNNIDRDREEALQTYTAFCCQAKVVMESTKATELYFVFMNYDPQYERLRSYRSLLHPSALT